MSSAPPVWPLALAIVHMDAEGDVYQYWYGTKRRLPIEVLRQVREAIDAELERRGEAVSA